MKLEDYFEEADQRPGVREAEEKLKARLTLAHAVIVARTRMGLSQVELAERVGTKQNSISRIESALANPTLNLVNKLCNILGITMGFQPNDQNQLASPSIPVAIRLDADTQDMVVSNWGENACSARFVSNTSSMSINQRFDA